jgi:hypothetical protein
LLGRVWESLNQLAAVKATATNTVPRSASRAPAVPNVWLGPGSILANFVVTGPIADWYGSGLAG